MSISNFYSLVVIGAGAGGLVVAIGFAKAGKKVLLIENGNYGGDCTNFGCIPSKTLIGLAKHQKKDLSFVRQIVHEVRAHEEPVSLNKLGVETLTAQASFLEPHVILAKEKSGKTVQVQAKKIVIATGSSPQIPPIPGLNDTPFLTNESIFNLEQIPKSLIVLGGGPIGSELAQAFQRLGTSVHLIHSHSGILARESKEASDILIERFRKEGMVLHLNSKVERVEYKSASFKVVLSGKTVEAERLLVATGRKPHINELQLEKAGVAFTDKGVIVDAFGRTSQKHIFAIGDATGPPFFTHLAESRGRTVLTTLLLSPFFKKKIDRQAIPRVTYTDPEIASIGLSEEEAFETYGQKKIAVYLVPMSEVDRAITQGRTEGFVKIVTKRWSSHILGATIICPRAGEMLSEISLAMFAKIPLRKLAGLIHPYPTYSLAIRRAADKWLSQTILSFIRTLWKK